MGAGPTTTLGFIDAQGNWTPVTESNPMPIGGATAGLNTVGFLQGVFIANGGTIPPEAVSPYIVVIEQA